MTQDTVRGLSTFQKLIVGDVLVLTTGIAAAIHIPRHFGLDGLLGAVAAWGVFLGTVGVLGGILLAWYMTALWGNASPKARGVGAEMKADGHAAGPSAAIADMVFDELEQTDGVEVKDRE